MNFTTENWVTAITVIGSENFHLAIPIVGFLILFLEPWQAAFGDSFDDGPDSR